jgi:site-specific DNA-methyltransferase (adenine-specific)
VILIEGQEAAGLYETGGMKVPRLPILAAAQILDNRGPQVPFGFNEVFKKAGREDSTAGE